MAKPNGKLSELSLKRKTFLFKKKSQRESQRFSFEAGELLLNKMAQYENCVENEFILKYL